VRAIAEHLGAPAQLVGKVPTADLEDDRPGLPDETVHGISYDAIDDYLEDQPVDADVAAKIERTYAQTAHKRALPAAP
jgi:NAD+ synthase